MKNILKTLWLALVATTFVACQDPAPAPEPPAPKPTENSMTYGADQIEFKSIVISDKFEPGSNYVVVMASPEAGITSAEEMVRQTGETFVHKFVLIAIAPENLNKTINVMGTDEFYFSNKSDICAEIKDIQTKKTTTITAGTIKTTWSKGAALTAEFDFTVKSTGTHLTGKVSGAYAPAAQLANAIEFDGANKTEFKSIVFDDADLLRLYVYASETAGLETVEAITKGKHLMVMVGYGDMNKTINAMTESVALFGMANATGVGSEITQCGAGMYPDIKAGTFVFTHDPVSNAFTATLSLTAKESGKVLNANISSIYIPKVVAGTNVMKYNDASMAVLSKYYEPLENETKFIISPFQLSAADVVKCAYVATIVVGKDLMNGEKHDIAKLADGFEFIYSNVMSQVNVSIKAGDLKGATGDFSVISNGAGNFTLEYQIVIDGNTIYGQADNLFTEIGAAADLKNTYMLYIGGIETKFDIKSVVLDKTANGGANWDIYISHVEGLTTVDAIKASDKPVVIRTTSALMNGTEVSLKEIDGISLSYDGTTYDKTTITSEWDEGAILSKIEADRLTTTFYVSSGDFYLDGEYAGAVTVVE